MIARAVALTVEKLGEHLRTRWPERAEVVAARLSGPGGQLRAAVRNRIVVQMVNLAEAGARRTEPRRQGAGSPAVGVWLLFAANFDDYSVSLQALSDVIEFFEATPVLTAGGLRASFMRQAMSAEDQRAVWATIGHDYIPSAMFNVVIG
jgi:hypothetical protein